MENIISDRGEMAYRTTGAMSGGLASLIVKWLDELFYRMEYI